MRNEFEEAVHFRHACKLFNPARKITSEDLHFILENTRLSPSSFGMEGWKFLVIQNGELKESLQSFCWNQPQITTCSDLIVLLSMKNLRSSNPYVREQFKTRGDLYEKYIETYKFYRLTKRYRDKLLEWQTSIYCFGIFDAGSCLHRC